MLHSFSLYILKFLVNLLRIIFIFFTAAFAFAGSCNKKNHYETNTKNVDIITSQDFIDEYMYGYKSNGKYFIALKTDDRYSSLKDFLEKEYNKSPDGFVNKITKFFYEAAKKMEDINSKGDLLLRIYDGTTAINLGTPGSGCIKNENFDNTRLVKNPFRFKIENHIVTNHVPEKSKYIIPYSGSTLLVVPVSEDAKNRNAISFNIEVDENKRNEFYKYAIEFIVRNINELNPDEIGFHVVNQTQKVVHFRIPFAEKGTPKHITIAKNEHSICTKCNRDVNTPDCLEV